MDQSPKGCVYVLLTKLRQGHSVSGQRPQDDRLTISLFCNACTLRTAPCPLSPLIQTFQQYS